MNLKQWSTESRREGDLFLERDSPTISEIFVGKGHSLCEAPLTPTKALLLESYLLAKVE